jgi:TP901 family phage tail tape measure protein
MNSYLNITIRVESARALAEARRMQAAVRGIGDAGGQAAKGLGPLDRAFANVNKLFSASSGLEKFGKNLQWTGRQLEYNFTLPLALAGAAATKWALDNESAMTRVAKVYGDVTDVTHDLGAELKALERSFELLSNRFGVQQKEVIDIAGAWAQAGVAGVGLAKGVEATLEAMILGEMDATKATEGLIAVQAAYRLSSQELKLELARLNSIENATSISFGGLIDVIQRAGGTARTAGIDIRHLAAMAASLVPAAGSAAQAGNSLRTMISRIMTPTQDAVDILQRMGIEVTSFAWQSKNGIDRIMELAVAFQGLDKAQKTVVSSLIASRWQVNRFDILMGDILASTGSYNKALEVTAENTDVLNTYTRELVTYMSSTPLAFKILTTQIQNALARAILPMLPAMVALLTRVVELTNWFAALSPEVQQLALMGLLALAVIGPLTKYIGALSTLVGLLGKVLGFVTVALSKKAAASVIAAAADEAHAGAVDHVALAAARARVAVGAFFASLWSIATFPFRAIGFLMSAMWTAFIVSSKLALAAAGLFFKGLYVLMGQLPALGRVMLPVWTAMTTAMSFIWQSMVITMQFLWVAFSAAFATISQALVPVFSAVTAAMQFIWIGFGQFFAAAGAAMLGVWQSVMLAMIYIQTQFGAGYATMTAALQQIWFALGQAVVFIWEATMAAVATISQAFLVLWGMVAQAAQFVWAALGEAIIVIQAAMLRAWQAMGLAMTAVWATTAAAIQGIWIWLSTIAATISGAIARVWALGAAAAAGAWRLFTTAMATIWAALPSLATIVAGAVSRAWAIAAAASRMAWALFTTALPAMWAALPAIASAVASAIVAAFSSPWVIIAAGIVALALVFRRQIGSAVQWVMDQFNKLPQGIANIFRSIVRMVGSAVRAIVELISNINPFNRSNNDKGSYETDRVPMAIKRATGGPVPGTGDRDSVLAMLTPGEFVINKKAAEALGPEVLKRLNAYAAGGLVQPSPALSAFNQATAGGRAALEAKEFGEMKADVLAFSPNAGPAFDALVASLKVLQGQLQKVSDEYLAQKTVVDALQAEVDGLNRVYDAAKLKLEGLKDAQSAVKDELDAAKDLLTKLGSTDITGMRAMGDQIFENEMAQKRLRLEIMKMEEEAGGSLDDMIQRMAMLQGEIEGLNAERTDLRMAGAGSDILHVYDEQIAKLEEQRVATQHLVQPIKDAQKELEELQRQGEMLNLEQSITFDPQLRQIEQMVNGLNEMPFDEIISSIEAQRAEVERLTAEYDAVTAAVEKQELVVQNLENQRDKAQLLLDTEKDKLDAIADSYDRIETQIREGEQALKDFAQAAASAKGDTSLMEDIFAAGEGANFDIPGGDSGLGREGDIFDIEAFNKEQEALLEEYSKSLGKIDLFKPFKDMWNSAWKWIKDNVGPVVGPVFEDVKTVVAGWWDSIFNGEGGIKQIAGEWDWQSIWSDITSGDFESLFQPLLDAWDRIGEALEDTPIGTAFKNISDILEMVGGVFGWFAGFVMRNVWPVVKEIGGWFVDAGKILWDELKKWAPLFEPFIEAIGHVYSVVTWFFKVFYTALVAGGALILAAWAIIWPVLFNVAKPIFDMIVGLVVAAMEIIRGVITVVLGIINGDWSLVWNGMLTVLEGIWDAIYAVVSGVFGTIYGVIKGIIESIVNIFTWLYDVLIGHSIVPDLVNGILEFFQILFDGAKAIFEALGKAIKWVWDYIILPVWKAFQWAWTNILWPVLTTMLAGFDLIWKAIGAAVRWVWDNVLVPVWNLFKALWDGVLKPVMDRMLQGFMNIWAGIGYALTWVWNTVLSPIWDLFKNVWSNVLQPAMNGLRNGFKAVWNGVADAIRNGVNLGIKAINFLINGLNAISDVVPGIDFHINTIEEFKGGGGAPSTVAAPVGGVRQMLAAGGRIGETDARILSGMKVNRPTAVVGEGSPLYPEYVVPTDPRYRSRALDLWTALGRDLGTVSGASSRKAETGGVRDWIDKIPTPGDVIDQVRKGAATAAFAPFLKLFDVAVSPVFSPVKEVAKELKNKVYDFVKGVDDSLPEGGPAGSEPIPGTGGWQNISTWLRNNSSVPHRITSTYRAGDPGFHGKNRAVDFAGPRPSRDSDQLLAINQALLPIAKTLSELIYSGPGGQSYKNGALHAYSSSVRADHHDHVHAALAMGGRLTVGRRPGGTLLRVGEGRWDEEVQVKPIRRSHLDDGGGRTLNFYGDLEFPNITSADDAEAFIRNLEDLV